MLENYDESRNFRPNKEQVGRVGRLIIITGPTASGKDSVTEEIAKKLNLKIINTNTTRDPRDDDKCLNYIDEEEFLKMKENNEFLEFNKYGKAWYGTSKKPIQDELLSGHSVLCRIHASTAL